ncbi:conserved hypothetical protein [Microsporum canis CBS 113480]|uniref:Uncharacterized protein n=1 Tax=Arthroderma otae (strain ATCC MYA-4605 / CBS 113480) TaxID=554155 RepID=C5FYK6_ARTOC|nr:conserved hypothetical protein [Microsporum canis CBS 113480]EEQ34604.1 conserved hypothetical protein [Microsporum canis CBS 113480]
MATSPTADLNPSQIDDPTVKDRLKEPFTWGWVVYRCSYGDEEIWQRMLKSLQKSVEDSLALYQRMDLLPSHRMTIMECKDKFDGATSHDIRDHFTNWVADTLVDKLVITPSESDQQMMREIYSPTPGPEWNLGTRHNFCLFVDDICLESLKHMSDPVIKLLGKKFGVREPGDRDYIVYPGWEDGDTDCEEEDVGWIYIEILDHVSLYDMLMQTDFWYDLYSRPPLMWNMFDRTMPDRHPTRREKAKTQN